MYFCFTVPGRMDEREQRVVMDKQPRNIRIIVLLALIIPGFWMTGCIGPPDPMSPLKNATHYLNLHDSVEYVGMQTCKECHFQIYTTYLRTGMGQSFDTATRSKSAAVTGPDSVLYDPHTDLYIQPYWRGDSLLVQEYRLQNGDTVHKRTEFINYVVGSGQHTNSHIYLSGQYAYQVPFTYYTQDGLFDMPPGFEDGRNSRFDRAIGLECMSCHNGFPELVAGSMNKYKHIPDGIDCERCHGPGEIHVMLKKNGFIVDTSKTIDYSIVNPAKLPVDRQIDVCARCHLQGTMVLQPNKSFYDFRPGMNLDTVMDIFMPLFEGGKEDFIMASHYERLVQSPCFLETDQAISCTKCHNPHISKKETPNRKYNHVCLSCHKDPESDCGFPVEKRLPVQDNCVQCHMREGPSRDIPHVRTHDHKISIPPTPEVLNSKKRFKGLVSVNNPQTDPLQKARGYLLEYESFHPDPNYLDSAWFYLNNPAALENKDVYFNARINYYFLRNDFEGMGSYVETIGLVRVLNEYLTRQEYGNYDAWTAYRIGQGYENTGSAMKASYFYKKAVELAPYILDFQLKFGGILAIEGKLDEAEQAFSFVLEEDPRNASAHVNLGYLAMKRNRLLEAQHHYEAALKLHPDHLQGLLNLAALKTILGEQGAGRVLARRVLVLDPENLQAKMLLNQQ